MIEDNAQNAYLAKFLLEQDGFEVVHAATGTEGLELARQSPFDAILLDIQLPEIDGYEIARTLRLDPAFASVPIIALSSYAMLAEKQKAFAIGCNGYLEKPIAPLKFAGQIRAHLRSDENSGSR